MVLLIRSSLMVALLFLLSGCATSIKTYQGKTLSLEESAILTCEPFLSIRGIDGDENQVIASGGGLWFRDCVVSLTPGKHSVRVRYVTGGTVSFSTGFVTLNFNGEKGNIYRIKYDIDGTRWSPRIEKLTGEELATQRKRVKAELAGK